MVRAPEPLDLSNAREVKPTVFAVGLMLFAAAALVSLGFAAALLAKQFRAEPVTEDRVDTPTYMIQLGADRWMRACAYEAGANGMSREAMERACGVDWHVEPLPKMRKPVDPS